MGFDEAMDKLVDALCEAVFGKTESQLEGRDADAGNNFRRGLEASVNMGPEIVIQETFYMPGKADGKDLFESNFQKRRELQEKLSEIMTALLY